MDALIRHFGDTSDGSRPCGNCDSCDPQQSAATPSRQPNPSERADLISILNGLKSGPRSTGKLFTDLHLTKDRKLFDGMLDSLARAGLINISSDSFRAE